MRGVVRTTDSTFNDGDSIQPSFTAEGHLKVSSAGGGSGGGLTNTELRATPVPVSGTVTVSSIATAGSTQQGAVANPPYADSTGAASGTMVALLKGLFVQNAQIITLLTAIRDNTATP